MSTNHASVVFRENLRSLIRDRGLTQKQAAEEIDVPYEWLRKACAYGISRPQQRTMGKIEKVRVYFGVERSRLLWSPSLKTSNRPVLGKYSDDELHLAIEGLKWAFQVNPRHKTVRRALTAMRRATTTAANDQNQSYSTNECQCCCGPLTEIQLRDGICDECAAGVGMYEEVYKDRADIYEPPSK